MSDDTYLKPNRLQDVIAAIQFLGSYPDYDLTLEDFLKKIATLPKSAASWDAVLLEHPEFFRKSATGADYSLVLRRARPKGDDKLRPPLEASELSLLVQTAINLQKNALESRRDRRAFLPVLISSVGIIAGFVGTILGASINSVELSR